MNEEVYNDFLKQRCDLMKTIINDSKIRTENLEKINTIQQSQYDFMRKESKKLDSELKDLFDSI